MEKPTVEYRIKIKDKFIDLREFQSVEGVTTEFNVHGIYDPIHSLSFRYIKDIPANNPYSHVEELNTAKPRYHVIDFTWSDLKLKGKNKRAGLSMMTEIMSKAISHLADDLQERIDIINSYEEIDINNYTMIE